MKLFTKIHADLFGLTVKDSIGLFGNLEPIKTAKTKACRISPHKNCKIHPRQTYGRLTVLGFVGQNNWMCKCSCGNTKVIKGQNLRETKSCGCLAKEVSRKRAKHGMCKTSEYSIWRGMLARCENPKCASYKYYGGRGITACSDWHNFVNFFKDMGKRPGRKTLERTDNDLGYCPKNCIWASWKVQANNKRKRIFHTAIIQRRFVAGHIKSRQIVRSNNQSAFARVHSLSAKGISMCLYGELKQYKGWKFRWVN